MDNQEVYYNKYINYKLKYLRLKKEAENNSSYDDEINYLEGLIGGSKKKDTTVDYTKKIKEAILEGETMVKKFNNTYIKKEIKEEMLKEFKKINENIKKNENEEMSSTKKLFDEAIKSYEETVNKDLKNLQDKKRILEQKMVQRQEKERKTQEKLVAEMKIEENALNERNIEMKEKINKQTNELKEKLLGMDAAELEADKTEISMLINNFNSKLIEYKNKAMDTRLSIINKIRGLATSSKNKDISDHLKKNPKYKNLTKKLYNPDNLEMPKSFSNIKKQLQDTMDLFDPSLPKIGLSEKDIKELVDDKDLIKEMKKKLIEEEQELQDLEAKLKTINKTALKIGQTAANDKIARFKKTMDEGKKKMEEKEAETQKKINKAMAKGK